MDGAAWDRLSALVAETPGLVLSPANGWDRLCERLFIEAAVSDGVAWMRRAEAYHRLISHPVAHRHAIAAAASVADDRSTQSMIGMMAVFTETAHPAAARVVVRHLDDPASGRTFYGALLASVKKLRYGHFSLVEATRVLAVAAELIARDQSTAALAARLVTLLPEPVRARISPRLREQVRDAVEPAAVRATHRACDKVWVATATEHNDASDAILRAVALEMVHDPVFDVRLCAMFQLYASPYRGPMAGALAAELVDLIRFRGNQHRIARLLEALRVLGGPAERGLVERLVLNPHIPADVLDMAAYALGHIGGTSTDAFYRAALHTTTFRPPQIALSVRDRLVYAIGIAGRSGLLQEVGRQPDLPSPVRAAARWWLTLPPHVRYPR